MQNKLRTKADTQPKKKCSNLLFLMTNDSTLRGGFSLEGIYMIKWIEQRCKEKRALHEHMERLSVGSDAPSFYFDYSIPERFAEMYRLSIVDSLLGLAFCLMGLNALAGFGKFVEKLFR